MNALDHVLHFKPMPALRKGWRDPSNQTNVDGRLSGCTGNDAVSVNIAGAATLLKNHERVGA